MIGVTAGAPTVPDAADSSRPAAQPPGSRVAAFFDLDGTLIQGSANIPLAVAAFRRGFVTTRELARDLRNGIQFLLHGAGDDRSAEVRERILAAVAGHLQSDVVALGETFIGRLVASVQPAMREVLDEHGAQGHDRVIVSASPTEIVSRLAAEIGMEHGLGTTSEVVDGRYTGKLAGPFCYREGKAEVITQMAADQGYDLAASFAYSDSISDLPMLRAVGTPVAVNPEAELRAIAVAEGWRIVETNRWRATSPRKVADAGRLLAADSLRRGRSRLPFGRPGTASPEKGPVAGPGLPGVA